MPGWLRFSAALFFYLSLFAAAASAEPLTVTIGGLEGEMLENVRAALTLPPGLVREGRVDRRWLERFRRQTPATVRRALEPFGYYEADVTASVASDADGDLRLQVEVRPGKPVRISWVRVGIEGPGEGRSALQEEVEAFPLRPGEILRHDLYEQAKGELQSRAVDLGYLDAEYVTHVIRVSRMEKTAEIELILDTGPRFRFGPVGISGAPEYPEKFLRRYLAFEPGDNFSYARLGQTQLNLLDSDRFREVVITPQLEAAADLQVPIEVQLVPVRPRRLRPGIGYGTDTGARFSLQYRDLNLFRLGQELEAEFLIAEFKQSIGTAYIIPSSRSIDSQTAFRVGYDQEELDVYDRRTLFTEVERTRSFGRGRLGSLYLRLLQEDFTIGEEDSTSRLVLPGGRFSRRRYLDPVRPQEGYQFSLEARGAHQVLGSDTGLLQVLAGGNFLLPLPARFSLFFRMRSGFTWQNEPLREIPPSLRFFAGGDRSVRGYAYQSIGIEDSQGDVVGGKNLLEGSVEVERAIGANWGVALFFDAGDAFNSYNDVNWRQGAGLGGRWYTPVGPVKLDLARQIGEEDPSWRLHLSVGFGW